MRRRPRSVWSPLLAVLVTGALLTSCGSDDSPDPADAGEQPDATAAAFVEGLTSGDLGAVPFTRGTAATVSADYADVVEGMGDLAPAITLGDVTEEGDTATAAVSWSWPLTDDDTWRYDAPVELDRVDGSWAVVWGHQDVEPSLNASSVLDAGTITPTRGQILGGDGTALVTDRSVVRVGIDRTAVSSKQVLDSARRLARLLDVDVSSYVARVKASGPKAFIEAITYRADDLPTAKADAATHIKGALLASGKAPLAPTRTFAAPILGSVGEVTAEMISDHPDLYSAGDVAGLSGLQARYDEQLRGTPGVRVDAVGSDGKQRKLHATSDTAGEPLHTTLDQRLQERAEALLSGVAPASALVAIRPSTGAILAAANGPGNGGQNFATFGQYAPGSTFKSVSSLALLRAGLTPSTPVPCTPTITVDGRVFENYDDYPASALGTVPLRTAVANSCNTAFISQRTKIRRSALEQAAATLGLGIDHAVGFPAFFGSLEPADSDTGAAANMIGQGTVLASPMAMATVIASIEHGSTVVPRLVEGVDGLETDAPAGVARLTGREDAELKTLLRGVVTSGSGRGLLDVPGPPVIAKSGTAEFDAPDGSTRTHAWMIGAQGDLAVAVFVDVGASDSGTAGPILESFLRAARGR